MEKFQEIIDARGDKIPQIPFRDPSRAGEPDPFIETALRYPDGIPFEYADQVSIKFSELDFGLEPGELPIL